MSWQGRPKTMPSYQDRFANTFDSEVLFGLRLQSSSVQDSGVFAGLTARR